jgi:hypothetical protein
MILITTDSYRRLAESVASYSGRGEAVLGRPSIPLLPRALRDCIHTTQDPVDMGSVADRR